MAAPSPADAVTPGSPAQLKGKPFGVHHGESEAAEVLAGLLAGDTPGSSSGGPAAIAPPTAGPAAPSGAPHTRELRAVGLLYNLGWCALMQADGHSHRSVL